jgi:hypothetical protein
VSVQVDRRYLWLISHNPWEFYSQTAAPGTRKAI